MKDFLNGFGGRMLLLILASIASVATMVGSWWALEVGRKIDDTAATVVTVQTGMVDRMHAQELKLDQAVTRSEWSTDRLRIDAQQRDLERTITDMRIINAQTSVSLNAIEKKLDQIIRDKQGGE